MPQYITLEYDGTERTITAWHFALDGCTAEFWNQKPDVLRIRVPGGAPSDAEIFPFEALVIFRINRASSTGADNSFSAGTVEFQGKRVGEIVDLRPEYEGVQYQFLGPLYDLQNTVYQQPFGSWQSGSLTFPYTSELLMFTELNTSTGVLSYITNGAQIQDILQFVLDQYSAQSLPAPFQIGTIDPALNLMPLPCKPMPSSDAIQKCLELSPDCTLSFDYTTTDDSGNPLPTANVKSVYHLEPVTLPLVDGVSHKSLRLVPRPELMPRAVIVNFKVTSTIGGVNFIGYLNFKYGPNGANSPLDPDGGLRVIVDWLDALGPTITDISQGIETTPVLANDASQANRRAFWAAHDRQFADLRLRMQNSAGAATTFGTPTVVDADTGAAVSLTDYPNELIDGTIAPWMGFNVKRVKISVPLTYAVYDQAGASDIDVTDKPAHLLQRFTQKEHHVEITLTNGTTGTYVTADEDISGEAIPTDLAQNIWTALNRLQYEGDYVKVESAISGGFSLLNVLNLSNGRTEWATMKAQIQGLRKDYGHGETSVTVGPAKHLNAAQMMDIFRAWRFRLVLQNPAVRASGDPGTGAGATEISKNTPKKNTMEGLENPSAQAITYHDSDSPTGTVKGQCIVDAKTINDILIATTPTPVAPFGATDIQTIQVRELAGCDEAGNLVYFLALAAAPYTKP